MRQHYPAWLLYAIVGLLLVANTINIAADVDAMANALNLIIGGPTHWYVVGFGTLTLHLHGITDIQTSAQAASALRPIAGELAFMLFNVKLA